MEEDSIIVPDGPLPPVEVIVKKTRRAPGLLSAAQLKAIELTEQVARVARRPEHLARLQAREISVALLDTLQADADLCRDIATQAVKSTVHKSTVTARESDNKTETIIAIQEIQAAACQRFARTEPARLSEFYVGVALTRASRPLLHQIATALLETLRAPDAPTLPGITAAKLDALEAKRDAWMSANASQSDNQSDSTRLRAELTHRIKLLSDKRLEVQFAADAEYPYRRPENHAVRAEFALPARRPLRVVRR